MTYTYIDINEGKVKEINLTFTKQQIKKAGKYLKEEIDKYCKLKEKNNHDNEEELRDLI